MSKFTPGPWKWFETENGDARVNPQNGGLVIAQCSVRDPFDTEQSANARLIATAPDLLAMLVEAHDIIDAIGQPETAEVAARMRGATNDHPLLCGNGNYNERTDK